MPNMSYCRFQNTLADLQECADHLEEHGTEELKGEEFFAAEALIQLCADITHREETRDARP